MPQAQRAQAEGRQENEGERKKEAMSKKLTGTIHVGRVFGYGVTRPISIEIGDDLSGTRICDIELTLEQYGDLVSGSGTVDCQIEIYDCRNVGKKLESKVEFVPFIWGGWHKKKAELKLAAAKAAKPFMVDGWDSYRLSDFDNHHCSTEKNGAKGQNVVFWRYVDIPTAPPA